MRTIYKSVVNKIFFLYNIIYDNKLLLLLFNIIIYIKMEINKYEQL